MAADRAAFIGRSQDDRSLKKVDAMFSRFLPFLKKLLFYAVFPFAFFAFLFFLGEQFEVGRLGAYAACESNSSPRICIRTKGYLQEPPFYPDLGRRYIAGFARWIGGDLGGSYRFEPTPAPEPEVAPAPMVPPIPAPAPAGPATLPLPKK